MAEEANPTYNNPHFRIVTTEIHVATGKVTATMVTATMEPTCLQMQVIGRELYSQYTSLMHPKTNNGLGPTLVAGQAGSLKALKGVDFTMNTYMTELCFLANPTSNHAPFTEPGKIDMNSLALLNIKKTREAIDSLSMICAVHA